MASLTPVTDPAILEKLNSQGGLAQADPATAERLNRGIEPLGAGERFGTGVEDIGVGAGRFAGHLMGTVPTGTEGFGAPTAPVDPRASLAEQLRAGGYGATGMPGFGTPTPVAEFDKAAQTREQEYKSRLAASGVTGPDWWRMGGNIAATAPLGFMMPGAAAPGLAARMLSGAATGLATTPLTDPAGPSSENYWGDLSHQGAINTLGGAAAPAVFGAAARMARPNVSPEVQTLIAHGNSPTIGEMLGGSANRLEQAATSLPITGDFINNARTAVRKQFMQGAGDDVLGTIGQKLEANSASREAMQEIRDKVTGAFNSLVSKIGIQASSPETLAMNQGIHSVLVASAAMPRDTAAQLARIIQSKIYDNMSSHGGMTGQSWKDAESEIGKLAFDLGGHGSTGAERQLSGALLQVREHLRDALVATDPAAASDLMAAKAAWPKMLAVQKAYASLGGEPGVYTPAQLQAGSKAVSTEAKFASGLAPMQTYAEAGKSVLGSTVPDSGTPYRRALQMATMALLGTAHNTLPPQVQRFTAPAFAGYMGLAGLAGAAYSPPGRYLSTLALGRRPDWTAPVSQGIRSAAPLGSSAVAPAFGALGF